MIRTVSICAMLVAFVVFSRTKDILAQEHHASTVISAPSYPMYKHETYHVDYDRMFREVNAAFIVAQLKQKQGELGPGDAKFMRNKLGPIYEKLYAEGKCNCKWGYCRPTFVRNTELDAETGYDVMVNGKWFKVPEDSFHNEESLSPELMSAFIDTLAEERTGANGHVCAYPDTSAPGGQRIECVIYRISG